VSLPFFPLTACYKFSIIVSQKRDIMFQNRTATFFVSIGLIFCLIFVLCASILHVHNESEEDCEHTQCSLCVFNCDKATSDTTHAVTIYLTLLLITILMIFNTACVLKSFNTTCFSRAPPIEA